MWNDNLSSRKPKSIYCKNYLLPICLEINDNKQNQVSNPLSFNQNGIISKLNNIRTCSLLDKFETQLIKESK